MPKQCEGCGYYSADNAPTTCPSCNASLKFTFLGQAGKAAAPLAGAPADPYADLERRQRAARAGLFGVDWRIVKAAVVGLVAVGGIGLRFYLRQEARDQREQQQTAAVSRIRPGMHISEAARLFNAGSNMPKWRGSIRNDFDPDDDSDGSMELNDGRNDVKVTWRNGYVTAVEPAGGSGGSGGTRRASAVTYDTDDDGPAPGAVVHPAERLVAPPGAGR